MAHDAPISAARRTPCRGDLRRASRPSSRCTGTSICLPRVCSCSMAAGRRRSAATISGLWEARFSRLASLPVVVVLPEPLSPTIRTTEGGLGAGSRRLMPPPRTAVSSSLVIFTTCWPGVRLLSTSSPSDRSRILPTKLRATRKFTSASRRAMRTSRRAASTSFSVRRPLLPRPRNTPFSFSDSVSNISYPFIGPSVIRSINSVKPSRSASALSWSSDALANTLS